METPRISKSSVFTPGDVDSDDEREKKKLKQTEEENESESDSEEDDVVQLNIVCTLSLLPFLRPSYSQFSQSTCYK